jgi:diketogulonate reductase-like aldo/keto reductase
MGNTLEFFKDNKVLNDIKDKYNISLSQLLLLLWLIRRNVIPIPASSNEKHMCENLSVLNHMNNPNILNIDEIDSISSSIGMNFPVIDTAQQANDADI